MILMKPVTILPRNHDVASIILVKAMLMMTAITILMMI